MIPRSGSSSASPESFIQASFIQASFIQASWIQASWIQASCIQESLTSGLRHVTAGMAGWRVLRRLIVAACLLWMGVGSVHAQDADPERSIEQGQTVTDSLTATGTDRYRIDLGEQQFVYAVAEQQTVDVAVTILGPGGEVVREVDVTGRGPEAIQFESGEAGTYRLVVSPYEKETGRYALTVVTVEPVATTPEGKVDQIMTRYDGTDGPGVAVGVVKNGELVFQKGYGGADVAFDVPFQPSTRSNVGSVSKQFTAYAITTLAEQGRLSLDDPVYEHVPEVPEFEQTVTLRHLLTHTSGYREYLNTLAMAGRRIDEGDYIRMEEVAGVVQRQPKLQNEPGTEFNYNNTGYALLAQVVENVSGTPFPRWMDENVFQPSGMTHTVVRSPTTLVVDSAAVGYVREDGELRVGSDLSASMGAGGIYSTIEDMAQWMKRLDEGLQGDDRVFKQMTTPYVLPSGDTTDYGLGLFLDERRGLRRIQHGGADIAHRAQFTYFPEANGGVILLSNDAGVSGSLPNDVSDAFFGSMMDDEEEAAEEPSAEYTADDFDPERFDAYDGQFELPQANGLVITFARDGDTYTAQATGQPKLTLTPASDTSFTISRIDGRVAFYPPENGVSDSLSFTQQGRTFTGYRMDGEAFDPSVSDLQAYEGRYFSEELLTFYTVAVENSALVLRHRRLENIDLTPTDEDTFSGGFPIGEVRFTRGDEGAVTGFEASNGRTRGVQFRRMNGEE